MKLFDRAHVRREGTRIFPPLIPASLVLVAWGLDEWLQIDVLPNEARWLGGVLTVVGIVTMAWSIMHQYRRGTDPNPFGETNVLVTDGPYRFSRNPIYVADFFLQAGIGLMFLWEWALVLLPLTWAGLRFLVIRNEEGYLKEEFGEEYVEYRFRVRRWL